MASAHATRVSTGIVYPECWHDDVYISEAFHIGFEMHARKGEDTSSYGDIWYISLAGRAWSKSKAPARKDDYI